MPAKDATKQDEHGAWWIWTGSDWTRFYLYDLIPSENEKCFHEESSLP